MNVKTDVETIRQAVVVCLSKIDADVSEAHSKLRELEPKAKESDKTKEVVEALKRAILRAQAKRHAFCVLGRAVQFMRPEDVAEVSAQELAMFAEIEFP